jgi:hypothetical protein
MTPLDKRVDWLLALWFVATLWSLFISGTVLLTPALYIFGPLIALALWLLPLLPLLAITWRNRFWARGRLWRWLPVFPLALAIDIMAIRFASQSCISILLSIANGLRCSSQLGSESLERFSFLSFLPPCFL